MKKWLEYIETAVTMGASDIFFVAGKSVCVKYEGNIVPLDEKILKPDDTYSMVLDIFKEAGFPSDEFERTGDADFSFSIKGVARFRVNAYKQRGSVASVIRVVSFDIPDWKQLRIPQRVMDISAQKSGLVLVTGTAGSGKTTTQACIIDRINKTRSCHIVTLEDPIEYLHRHDKSIVSQREISIDTEDYLSALRACVRQAPDIILLGEMRDAQTMQAAMSAAETGHLVIATLHNKGAVNAIDRIIDAFPSSQQGQIRMQLATVLTTVVSQQLLPDKNGGMVPAYEIMYLNNAIGSMIRDNRNYQIDSAIAAGSAEGMVSMDRAIAELLRDGDITEETAMLYADNFSQIKRMAGM